jgi:uncharacterized membrane protein YcjF (UPF0283 family)
MGKENGSFAQRLGLLKNQKDSKEKQALEKEAKERKQKEEEKKRKEKEIEALCEQIRKNIEPIWKTVVETCYLSGSVLKIDKYTQVIRFKWDPYQNSDEFSEWTDYKHTISLGTDAFKNKFSFDYQNWRENFENWIVEEISKEFGL